jgi:hypothetical protein
MVLLIWAHAGKISDYDNFVQRADPGPKSSLDSGLILSSAATPSNLNLSNLGMIPSTPWTSLSELPTSVVSSRARKEKQKHISLLKQLWDAYLTWEDMDRWHRVEMRHNLDELWARVKMRRRRKSWKRQGQSRTAEASAVVDMNRVEDLYLAEYGGWYDDAPWNPAEGIALRKEQALVRSWDVVEQQNNTALLSTYYIALKLMSY